MLLSSVLSQELFKIGWRSALAALVGLWFGHFWIGVALALALYVAMNLRYLVVLLRWFESPKLVELPEPGGLWGAVFERLLTLQKRNRKRKKRLSMIVAQFQATTEALPDAAVLINNRDEVLWFNGAAKQLLGLKSNRDLGGRLPNLLRHPQLAEYFEANQAPEIHAPSPINDRQTLAYRLLSYGRADGQRLLIARDISELERLNTVRRDFVANASHELRTPLTVLHGYAELMAQDSDVALKPWREPILEMVNQSHRMQSLLNDLLTLARLESEQAIVQEAEINISELVRRCVENARVAGGARHDIQGSIEANICLRGREGDLQSVFTNLISNALRYTPAGGRIAVALYASPEGVYFAVTDTGIGIAEQDIPRLTERFYRVDVGRSRASGGTGLGLSIVKHALEQHDGKLQITSKLGQGSTFCAHFAAARQLS